MLMYRKDRNQPRCEAFLQFFSQPFAAAPMMGRLPVADKHDRRERDRRERGNDGDQLGASADVDATDSS
jgi:hypothetical protein